MMADPSTGTSTSAGPDPAADPVTALVAIADLAQRGEPLPPALGHWLSDAIRGYILDGTPLPRSLGISDLHRSPRSAVQHGARNAALRQAGELLDGDVNLLSAAVALAQGRRVHAHRERLERLPQDRRAAARAYIEAAAQTGASLPSGHRQLRRILRNELRAPDVSKADLFTGHNSANRLSTID